MLRIVFMGTPDFAIPSLEAIVRSGHKLAGVVTQPDRPKGRGRKLAMPPVKEWAIERGFAVFQPEKVREERFVQTLKRLEPDLIVTAAFGQILPRTVLDIPRLGCINVHASLLPRYRGACPIQHAILNGEKETGITIMYMDEGMDTGDIILQKKIPIFPDERADELHDRLARLGGEALCEALALFKKGKPPGIPQDHSLATYAPRIDKSMGEIDWGMDATKIKNLVRGLTPWPGTYTFLDGRRIKVWSVRETDTESENHTPGCIVRADEESGIVVACGRGCVRLLEVQPAGGRIMSDVEFLRGHPVEAGWKLGRK